MNLNLLFAMAFGFIIILTLLSRLGSSTSNRHYQYRKHKALFTPAERSFLGVLDNAVSEQYRILGKVRIADVITPEKGMTRQHWQNAFNKISAKHFDYLLCDKQTLDVIAAIELDDTSHKQAKTIARDQLVEDACRTARLPLIRFDAKRSYHVESVRTTIASTLEPNFEPEIETIPQIIASRD